MPNQRIVRRRMRFIDHAKTHLNGQRDAVDVTGIDENLLWIVSAKADVELGQGEDAHSLERPAMDQVQFEVPLSTIVTIDVVDRTIATLLADQGRFMPVLA